MSQDVYYKGLAVAVAQVDKFTPSDPDTGDIFTLTATGLDGSTASVSFTVAATETVAAVTAGLVAAWNASTNALMTPITAADETTYLTLTADTAGTRFVVAGSADGGETLTREATTLNVSPKDWNHPDNWSVTAVAQVDTVTVTGNWATGDTITLTVTYDDGTTLEVTFTIAGTETIAAAVAGLVAAWNNSTDARCTGITAADAQPDLTLTADEAGLPFTVAVSVVTAGDGDASLAHTTPNTGAPGAAANDDAYIEDAIILYGLNQSGIANTLDSFNAKRTQLGSNPAAGTPNIYLQIKTAIANIETPTSIGTSTPKVPMNIDFGSTAAQVYIHNTGTNSPTTKPAVRIKANSATTDIFVKGGVVGIAFEEGETATVGDVNVSGGSVYVGRSVTYTNLNTDGGTVVTSSGCTTVTQEDGTIKTYGSGAFTTVNNNGGLFESNSSGTITTLTAKGLADFTKSKTPRTVTTAKLAKGGSIAYEIGVVTLTNGIVPNESTSDYTLTAA